MRKVYNTNEEFLIGDDHIFRILLRYDNSAWQYWCGAALLKSMRTRRFCHILTARFDIKYSTEYSYLCIHVLLNLFIRTFKLRHDVIIW